MTAEMEVITKPEELTRQVLAIRESERSSVLLFHLGSNLLELTESVFPGADFEKILVQKNDRELECRGPNFDVCHPFIKQKFPWIVLFNLSGFAKITALDLPEDLAARYANRYPRPTDAAFEARRLLSEEALQTPGAVPLTGDISPGTGVVLSQRRNGPHIVRNIVPTNPRRPGKYWKFVVPSKIKEASERLQDDGYRPLSKTIARGCFITTASEEEMRPASLTIKSWR